jgi:excinuclease UvrABC ATPase subunit
MPPSSQHRADNHDLIRVRGARQNNLKDVSIEIPKRRLTVFTGVSGSGKSSLVFGVIAAESQRLINHCSGGPSRWTWKPALVAAAACA